MAKAAESGEKIARRGFEPQDPRLKHRLGTLMTASMAASLLAMAVDWTLILAAAITSWLTLDPR